MLGQNGLGDKGNELYLLMKKKINSNKFTQFIINFDFHLNFGYWDCYVLVNKDLFFKYIKFVIFQAKPEILVC